MNKDALIGTIVVLVFLALMVMLVGSCTGACDCSGSGSSSGYSSYSGGSSSNSASRHSCYVCGESAYTQYGSYYYCKTHYAMVKTVVEAD